MPFKQYLKKTKRQIIGNHLSILCVLYCLQLLKRTQKIYNAITMEEVILKGDVLNDGIAYGKVCLFQEDLIEASPKYKISQLAIIKEKARLKSAMEETKSELKESYKRVSKFISKAEAEVFNAHILMVEDPSFLEKISGYIENELINAEFAVQKTLYNYEQRFQSIANDYIKERGQDIREIGKKIIRNMGMKHEQFMCSNCHAKSSIIAAKFLSPSLIAGLYNKNVSGIIAQEGSQTSHGAILAKSMGIACLINIPNVLDYLGCGKAVLIDAEKGELYINPSDATLERFSKTLGKKQKEKYNSGYLLTKDNVKVNLFTNAGSIADVKHAKEHSIKSVGLFRTEFLFLGRKTEPSVPEQVDIYKKVMDEVKGTVTFRLLDIGGDKFIDFISLPTQENPGLGLRGSRIYQLYPNIISNQIEALLLAKGARPMNILVPMVSTVTEFLNTKKLILRKLNQLNTRNAISGENLKIGCMVEVPSAVYLAQYLAQEADFLSIGTNDLIQYIMGVDRANAHLGDLLNPLQPAIIRVLDAIIKQAGPVGKEITVCGEVASDPKMVKVLFGLGYRNLSINLHRIEKIGDALLENTSDEMVELAQNLLQARAMKV